MAVGTAMPQDVLKYKAKFIGNFTLRQACFYAVGVILGLLVFLKGFHGLEDGGVSMNVKIVVTACVMLPFFLWGGWQPFGLPLEKILIPYIKENIASPAIRRKEVHFEELDRKNAANPKEKPLVPKAKSGYRPIR